LYRGDGPQALNFGPDSDLTLTPAELTHRLLTILGAPAEWRCGGPAYPETALLRIDSGNAMRTLGWRASTDIDQALAWTADWHKAAWHGDDMRRVGQSQIDAWLSA
jgi:CDP-glucose 4,6-dehydratase